MGFAIILVFELQKHLDLGVPLMHIAAFLACAQWLLGPIWFYYGNLNAGEMGMYVPEHVYFRLALPGTAAFAVGLLYFCRSYNQSKLIARVNKRDFMLIGAILNGIAFASEIVGLILPGKLAFAFFLVAQLRYVGCMYIICSRHPWRVPIGILCMVPLLMTSAKAAMFHDLLLWSGIVFCCWFSTSRHGLFAKLATFGVAAFVAFNIQAIKESYRKKVWHGHNSSLTGEMIAFWKKPSNVSSEEVMANAMVRLNQGWIISAVMAHVPTVEQYAHGDTVLDAVQSAYSLRIVNETKAKAGGRSNFIRFTGLEINESTSMNVSMLGEGYANFGVEGAILFMGIVGSGMALLFSESIRWAGKYPTFILWMPLIFYQAVKAETDLTEVLNQVVKGGLVVAILFALLQLFQPDQPTKRPRLTYRGRAQLPIPRKREVLMEYSEN
jgi:hypothetical protein